MASLGEMMNAHKTVKSILENYEATEEQNTLLLEALRVFQSTYELPLDENKQIKMDVLKPFIDKNFSKIQKIYSKKLMNHFATISMFDESLE
jgi:hypothetical protein